MAGPIATAAGTIVPRIKTQLAKSLDWEEAPDDWQQTVEYIPYEGESDTYRFIVFTMLGLPDVKAPMDHAKVATLNNYIKDASFHTLSEAINWPKELELNLPNFDVFVKKKAMALADGYKERLLQWRMSIMLGSAVEDGLPTLDTTCYDGLDLYTSSTRYRTSGGNTVTGTGIAQGSTVRKDFFGGIERLADYRHDQSNAKIWPNPWAKTWLLEFDPALISVFIEAFNAEIVQQSGGSTQSASNIFLEFSKTHGGKVKLSPNAYISGNSWYMTCLDQTTRPTFGLVKRQDVQVIPRTMQNDGEMASRNAEGAVSHANYGMCPLFPGSTLKVSNS